MRANMISFISSDKKSFYRLVNNCIVTVVFLHVHETNDTIPTSL